MLVGGLESAFLSLELVLCFYKLYKPTIRFKTLMILLVLLSIDVLAAVNVNHIIICFSFFIIMGITYYERKENIIYNFWITSFSFIMLLICDSITHSVLEVSVFVNQDDNIVFCIEYAVIFFILIFLILTPLSKVLNELFNEKVNKTYGKQGVFIIINLILSFMVIYADYILNKLFFKINNRYFLFINLIILIGYMLSTIGTAYFFNMTYKKEMQIEIQKSEMDRVIEYSKTIDDMYQGIRRFKHDYINILSSLNDYITDKNWEELEAYFKNNILETKKIVTQNDSIGKLRNINITYLKSLISAKIMKAESMGVKTDVDVLEEVFEIQIDPIDMSRVIGILMDNAIDGALESQGKTIRFGIIYKANSVVLIIENTCKPDIPPIYKMMEKSFSTKGNRRGIGLCNLKDIINKYTNVTFNVEIQNEIFKSEIWIKNV